MRPTNMSLHKSVRPEQPRYRGKKRRIIVDHMNDGYGYAHFVTSFSAIGSVNRNDAPPSIPVLCP